MNAAFLRRFMANPRRVGSIVPSGAQLVQSMLAELPLEQARLVVEFGPGLGAFTEAIMPRLCPGAHCVAVEIDHVFAQVLRDRFPALQVIEDSAEHIVEHLDALTHEGADVVVSGLPFANLPRDFRRRVIAGARHVLRPGGHFVTYQYLHARAFSRHLESCLRESFPVVDMRWTMANVPPAVVFHARA